MPKTAVPKFTSLSDDVLKHQIINHVIVSEYLHDSSNYASESVTKLADYGIIWLPSKTHQDWIINAEMIERLRYRLINGRRQLTFPAVFNGVCGSRYQKDLMYNRFWMLADIILSDKDKRVYCGLPANQIGMIEKEILNHQAKQIIACERNPAMFNWMTGLFRDFLGTPEMPILVQGDVFQTLLNNPYLGKINILDLDLMCNVIDVNQLALWSAAIYEAADDISILNLTTCVGRKTSVLQYESLMPEVMIKLLKDRGFKEVKVFRGKYRDRVIPMRYEHFVLYK